MSVPKRFAEAVLLASRALALVDNSLAVKRVGEYVLIPLLRAPSPREIDNLKSKFMDITISVEDFEPIAKRPKSLIELLEEKLPPYLISSLPRSYDIVGDIAILEIPPELENYKDLIGEAVLTLHKNVRTVLAKASSIQGAFRTRELTIIAGDRKTETTHREHGCVYHMDLSKVYFSPRLAYERNRVALQVQENETVIDMFAGVGPFSVLIAKRHRNIKVYAIDINPEAVRYLKLNIVANGVQDKVFPLQGDARVLIKEKLRGVANRVIMNLPAEAIAYIDVACEALSSEGGIIHFYEFASEPNPLESVRARLIEAVSKSGRRVQAITNIRLVKPTAPREWQVAIDSIIR
ncbi:class I SAM-dependent methyltransferase family protein [Candidatus Bathyarchaeota archaeon]|nr:class I SAM-dependent methyltransferase family protein [Candidatus Bathyarchaeota archaeon]